MTKYRLTDAQKAELRRRRPLESDKELASEFGIPPALVWYYGGKQRKSPIRRSLVARDNVRKRLAKYGQKGICDLDDNQVLEFLKTHTCAETAQQFGTSGPTVQRVRRMHPEFRKDTMFFLAVRARSTSRANEAQGHPNLSALEKKRIAELWATEAPPALIALKLGRGADSIRRFAKKSGLPRQRRRLLVQQPDGHWVSPNGWERIVIEILESFGLPWKFQSLTIPYQCRGKTHLYFVDFYFSLDGRDGAVEVKGWLRKDEARKWPLKRGALLSWASGNANRSAFVLEAIEMQQLVEIPGGFVTKLANSLGRSNELPSILKRLKGSSLARVRAKVGTPYNPAQGTWSKDEIRILKHHYMEQTPSELSKLLPDRTAKAIQDRAQVLGLRKTNTYRLDQLARMRDHRRHRARTWTPERIGQLEVLFPEKSSRDVAREMGISIDAVNSKAQKLGLLKSAHRRVCVGVEHNQE